MGGKDDQVPVVLAPDFADHVFCPVNGHILRALLQKPVPAERRPPVLLVAGGRNAAQCPQQLQSLAVCSGGVGLRSGLDLLIHGGPPLVHGSSKGEQPSGGIGRRPSTGRRCARTPAASWPGTAWPRRGADATASCLRPGRGCSCAPRPPGPGSPASAPQRCRQRWTCRRGSCPS